MTVGIVGLGLIGGSIGLALRDPKRRIIGTDNNPENERVAIQRGCVDEAVPIEQVAQAEIVFVATPPRATPDAVIQVLREKTAETVVTDCASIKSEVLNALKEETAKEPNFVGGHPMAGHEKSGPAFSSAWMFRNARWILTPVKGTATSAVKKVEQTVKLMGAVPVRMDPSTHDRHVAILSHVPHAVAASLVQLGEEMESWEIGAGSWRDLTRVGGVDPGLWTQIFMGNRLELAKSLEDLEGFLAQLRACLEQGDEAALKALLERAKLAKAKHEA